MAIGLSTSGTLFGIRQAEQTILQNQGRPVGQGSFIPIEWEWFRAMATLLKATANGNYRISPAVLKALGDTGTHEVGHVYQAEQTLLRCTNQPPAGYMIITLENCLRTLLSATATGYRPNPQVLIWIELGGFDYPEVVR